MRAGCCCFQSKGASEMTRMRIGALSPPASPAAKATKKRKRKKELGNNDYTNDRISLPTNKSTDKRVSSTLFGGSYFTPCTNNDGPTTTKMHSTVILFTLTIMVYTILTQCFVQLIYMTSPVGAIAPTIDYSHNMRVLKLPKSIVQVGDLIYRLKGSDADASNRLTFGSASPQARSLLDIVPVLDASHWNEADVYLRSQLTEPIYNLTIFVSDGTNKTTQVESTIIVTDPTIRNLLLLEQQRQQNTSETINAEEPLFGNGGCNSTSRLQALIASASTGTLLAESNSMRFSPFVRPRQVFTVAENTGVGEVVGSVSVLERTDSDLAVRFELRGTGADNFIIRYVFGPHGQARGELLLARPLDYEQQNMYQLKVLALNAWTNREFDTRNVHALDIVISVGDVQDTGPVFTKPDLIQSSSGAANGAQPVLWHPLQVSNRMRVGDLLTKVEARDGDAGDQRPIQYALDASSQLSEFFDIDKMSGEIKLLKPVDELIALSDLINLDPSVPLQLSVFASEVPDTSSYEHLWPPMYTRIELPLQVVDAHNDAPQFRGGWQSEDPRTADKTLHAYLPSESSSGGRNQVQARGPSTPTLSDRQQLQQPPVATAQTMVYWYTNSSSDNNQPVVIDTNRGLNGTFELTLEGADAHLFTVEPSYAVVRQTHVNLYVKSSELYAFDRDQARRMYQLDLVARDFGPKVRMSSKVRVTIELIDTSNNAPRFDSDLYVFSVYENSQLGTTVGTVRARTDRREGDAPAGKYHRTPNDVRYTSLVGMDSNLFKLDPETGVLSLDGIHLDRERVANYLFIVEAQSNSNGATNYTRVMINVLDVNDNAPVFTQASYDAVLMIPTNIASSPSASPAGSGNNLPIASVFSFQQPLAVKAIDMDEPNTANSQVAYEIIAGNTNEQFTIDSLSGAIYPTGASLSSSPTDPSLPPPAKPQHTSGSAGQLGLPTTLPSILSDPIRPYTSTSSHWLNNNNKQSNNRNQHHQSTPVPGREIEETTVPSRYGSLPGDSVAPPRAPRQRSDAVMAMANQTAAPPDMSDLPATRSAADEEQAQAMDVLLSIETAALESDDDPQRRPRRISPALTVTTVGNTNPQPQPQPQPQQPPAAVWSLLPPPVTTLIVRAHDFGIPLRSSTAKVNIYNPMLSHRYLSVILNGTAEQLEQRRDAIERTFGAVVGAKAVIESIDALSDSSQLSVARVKLTVPRNSLVDLTDLSALMHAIDYKGALQPQPQPDPSGRISGGSGSNQQQLPYNHYIAICDRLIPAANLTSIGASAGGSLATVGQYTIPGTHAPPPHYTDIQSYAMDASALERRLLIYIIIVGVCILALLVIWMVYSCSRENDREHLKVVDTTNLLSADSSKYRAAKGAVPATTTTTTAATATADTQTDVARTHAKSRMAGGGAPIAYQLYGKQAPLTSSPLVLLPTGAGRQVTSDGSGGKQQLWFEPSDRYVRASSAPTSTNGVIRPLDGALYATISGANRAPDMAAQHRRAGGMHLVGSKRENQFFPNTIGYTDNLSSIFDEAAVANAAARKQVTGRRHRSRVAPMAHVSGARGGHINEAYVDDEYGGAPYDDDTTLCVDVGRHKRRAGHNHRRRLRQTTGVQTSIDRPTEDESSSGASRSLAAGAGVDAGAGGQDDVGAEESSLGADSVVLDSDQELLGFDSSGAPIIATHAGTGGGGLTDATVAINNKPGRSSGSEKKEETAAVADKGGNKGGEVKSDKTDSAGNKKDVEPASSTLGKRLLLQRQTADVDDGAAAGAAGERQRDARSENRDGNDARDGKLSKSATVATAQVSDGQKGASQATGRVQRQPLSRSATQVSSGEETAETGSLMSTATTVQQQPGQLSTTMKNGELLEKQSIFAITYSGVATDKLPAV